MIIQNDFLNNIRDFGLNTYEAKLWTALLSRGISTAGELSDIANVPRSRSYDVLESLEKKGFIIMKIGKPIKYIAVHPNEVLERVKKNVLNEANKKSESLDKLYKSEVLKELHLLHTQGIEFIESSDLSCSFKGRDSIYNHIDFMIKKANDSVDIMTTTEGLLRKGKKMKNVLRKANERGVKIRIAAPLTEDTKDVVKILSQFSEVKNVQHNTRFCIVDDQELMFMLLNDNEVHPSYDTGVWVSTKFFSNTLKNFFNAEWEKTN